VARTGVHLAFDTIGKENWDFFVEPPPASPPDGETSTLGYHQSDVTRARRLAALVAEGFVDQILLAQDLTGAEVWMNPRTHGRWGYSYLGSSFTALLYEHGVTEEQVDTMLRHNPARLLATARS
jgi:phosphotriesterase-related protein